MSEKKIVVASGYFDPIHVGHLEYLERSAALGDVLVVIVNSDKQAAMKKGKPFMPCAERIRLLRALRCVDVVVEASDDDRSVCRTLRSLRPHIFTNAGDQTNAGVPEAATCAELGIKMVDGLGDKIQSSSWLVAAVKE